MSDNFKLNKRISTILDEYIDFKITAEKQYKTLSESEIIKLDLAFMKLNEKDIFFNEKDLRIDIFKINNEYKIDATDEVERKKQWARRNAYLTVLKKEVKRSIAVDIAFIIIKVFDIKQTSYYFFKNICELLLERSVDRKFIFSIFASAIVEDNEIKKLKGKRTASDKIKLDFQYKDYVTLERMINKNLKTPDNFKDLFESVWQKAHSVFYRSKIEYSDLSSEEVRMILLKAEATKEKEKVIEASNILEEKKKV